MGLDLTIEFKIPKTPLFDGTASRVIHEELDRAMNASVLHLKGQIVPLVPVGVTALLRGGVATSIAGEGVSLVGRVFDPVAYALPVELGSRPHFPPIPPIALWVRRKLGISDEREARSVAFLIARKISRVGTKPRLFFKRGFEAGKGRVVTFFADANARIVSRLTGGGGGA
jgi:hypothetical protein